MSRKKHRKKKTITTEPKPQPKTTLLAVTTCGRPWYFSLFLNYLAEADLTGIECRLYVDSGADPLNKQIAEKTNERCHVFDSIVDVPDHPYTGCQPIRNYIFHDFRAGEWERIIYCDDDLVFEPSIFQDLIEDLAVLRGVSPDFHFAAGYTNEFIWRSGVVAQEFTSESKPGVKYGNIVHHGAALWIGDREGWLNIAPEPWTIPPFDGNMLKPMLASIRRSGMRTGLRTEPSPKVQHLCNANTEVHGWKSGWAISGAEDRDGKQIEVPGFDMNEFRKHDEQTGADPAAFAPYVRKIAAEHGNKVWVPDGDYAGHQAKADTPVFAIQNPPAPRYDVMPDGRKIGVMIAIPTRTGFVHANLALRMSQWYNKYSSKYAIYTITIPYVRWPDMVRAQMARQFLLSDCEWLLQIDDDVVPPPNVLDMIEHGKDIVQAPAVVLVNGLFEWVGKRYHNRKGLHDMVFTRFPEELMGHRMLRGEIDEKDADGKLVAKHRLDYPIPTPMVEGLFPVDTVGTGCLLVRRCVYEKLGVTVHRTKFDRNMDLVNTQDGVFSEAAKAAGFDQWTDTSMRCEHWHGDMELSQMYDTQMRGLLDRYPPPSGPRIPGDRISRLPEPTPIKADKIIIDNRPSEATVTNEQENEDANLVATNEQVGDIGDCSDVVDGDARDQRELRGCAV